MLAVIKKGGKYHGLCKYVYDDNNGPFTYYGLYYEGSLCLDVLIFPNSIECYDRFERHIASTYYRYYKQIINLYEKRLSDGICNMHYLNFNIPIKANWYTIRHYSNDFDRHIIPDHYIELYKKYK